MKILLVPFLNGEFIFKTDNTLIKSSREYFQPDFVEALGAAPAFVVRIDKSAKYVSAKFAKRYYSEITTGINLSPFNLVQSAYYLDNTTFFTDKFININNIHSYSGADAISLNLRFVAGEKTIIIEKKDFPTQKQINQIIENSTKFATLKCGDLIYVELAFPAPVVKGDSVIMDHFSSPELEVFIR